MFTGIIGAVSELEGILGDIGGLFGGGRTSEQISRDEANSFREWRLNINNDGFNNVPDNVLMGVLRPVWDRGGSWNDIYNVVMQKYNSGDWDQYKTEINNDPFNNIDDESIKKNASIGGKLPVLAGLGLTAYFMFSNK